MLKDIVRAEKFDAKDEYVLGKTSAETDRLVAQASIILPITRRLLSEAG